MAGKSTQHLHPRDVKVPDEFANHHSHGFGTAITGHAGSNIARDGAPKKHYNVGVHDGMHTRVSNIGDRAGLTRVGGGDMKSALTSGSVGPGLGDMLPARPKVFADTKVTPGMRSRTSDGLNHDLGRAIIGEAVTNDGVLGSLPKAVRENT